jgi:hypothetical protein
MKILTYGKAGCTTAPMGLNGLEGFYTWQVYQFQIVTTGTKTHFRMFPDPDSTYYETCSRTIFNRYFKILP